MIQQNFDGLSPQQPVVEHLTIPGFLRLIEYRWTLGDIRQFGDKVQQVAEAMCLAYRTAVDRSLGELRMFPEPLLRRVYDTLAPGFGWPQIINVETPELEDAKKKRDTIKSNERVLKRLEEVITETDDLAEHEALRESARVLRAKTDALRAEIGAPAVVS
jgi:hypothetical protein